MWMLFGCWEVLNSLLFFCKHTDTGESETHEITGKMLASSGQTFQNTFHRTWGEFHWWFRRWWRFLWGCRQGVLLISHWLRLRSLFRELFIMMKDHTSQWRLESTFYSCHSPDNQLQLSFTDNASMQKWWWWLICLIKQTCSFDFMRL